MEILNKIAASQPHTGGVDPYDDAYWAKQPAEVQELRDMQEPGERSAKVAELITKGYKIDVPIMLYGWGPHQTNQLRAAYGYTWVPSATMEGIIMSPGLHAPGYPDYDPNNPPPGAILIDAAEIGDNPFKDFTKLPDYAQAPSGQTDYKLSPAAGAPSHPSTAAAFPTSMSAIMSSSRGTDSKSSTAPAASSTASPKLVATSGKSTKIPDDLMSSLGDAVDLQKRLEVMGYSKLPIAEQQPEDNQTPKYGQDTRRPYSLGGLNVGIVKGWYERMKEEDANQLVAGVMKLNATAQ